MVKSRNNLLVTGLLGIRRFVGWSVSIILIWMVMLALLQLLLRWFTSHALSWADIQLRQLVLWIGLLGAVLAASEGRHIRIDLVDHYLKGKWKKIAAGFVSILSGAGSLALGVLSFSFISSEKQAEIILNSAFFGVSIPIWIAELIIPVCFFLMSLYFVASAFSSYMDAVRGETS